MKRVTLGLYALLAVPFTFAFVVPDGLPDGVWSVSFDGTTGEVLQLKDVSSLQHLPANRSASAYVGHLSARQTQNKPPPLENPQIACGNYDLMRDAFELAKREFQKICDSSKAYPVYSATLVANQGIIAYMCSFNRRNRCWRDEYEEATGLMDRQCGNDRVASVYTDQWKKTYGRDVSHADICHE